MPQYSLRVRYLTYLPSIPSKQGLGVARKALHPGNSQNGYSSLSQIKSSRCGDRRINRKISGIFDRSRSARLISCSIARDSSSSSYSYKDSNGAREEDSTAGNGGFFFLIAAAAFSIVAGIFTSSKKSECKSGDSDESRCKKISLPEYARCEVQRHTTPETGIWVTYKDGVYDVTEFVANHPGGKDKLMLAAGKDLTELWTSPPYRQHFGSPLVFELLEEMRIGNLNPEDVVHVDMNKLRESFDSDTRLSFPSEKIYDCIVVGSGLSGLKCAHDLVHEHGFDPENVLVLEAQGYIGGRVRQMSEFIKGVKVDVGAEFLHGSPTALTKFAEEQSEPIRKIFCWAYGDGGPLEKPVENGYGLYYIKDDKTGKNRLLRFDDKDEDFVSMNKTLQELCRLDENDFSDDDSVYDFLHAKGFSAELIRLAEAGYANTFCATNKSLSLKQCIRWAKMYEEDDAEGDATFVNSYSVLVDHLKKDLQVELNMPVNTINYDFAPKDSLSGLVKLESNKGPSYYAKSLVVTASPHVLKSGLINFNPPLSEDVTNSLDTLQMNNIIKVIFKFSAPVWPKDLHGIVMSHDSWLIPEIWFQDVSEKVDSDEPAKAFAVCFCTAKYAERVASMPKEEVIRQVVSQLDSVFSELEPRHMSCNADELNAQSPDSLPKASDAFLGAMFWDWNPQHHPYIGGGYCSPKVNSPTNLGSALSKPYGKNIFFAGEATKEPGGTAHAALDSGTRAAAQVNAALRMVSAS